MTHLALVSSAPARPVHLGNRIHVPEAVPLACGRAVPRGHYDVLDVEATPAEHACRGPWRVIVEALPDCSALASRFQRPIAAEVRAGAPVPLCAQRTRFYLYPGSFIQYADGDGPSTIPDR